METPVTKPEVTERPVNRRHEVLKELAQAHDERTAKEAEGVGKTVEFEPAPRDEPVAKQEEPVAAQQSEIPQSTAEQPRTPDGKFASNEVTPAPSPAAVTMPPPAPELVTVKIDGETMQVPKAEIDAVGSVALYQIEKTSAKRLKQINAEKAEFAAWAAQQRQVQAQPQQLQQPAPNQDDVLKTLGEHITYGDDAQRVAAMKQLVAMAQQPAQQINASVQHQVHMALNVQKLNDAENQFVNNNRDLLFDADGQPNLSVVDAAKARVDRMKQQIVQTGQFPANTEDFYKSLEADMRKAFGKPAVANDIASRVDRKSAIAEPKTASGRVPPPAEAQQLTVSQQIDKMREARGQKPLYH